MRSNLWSPEGWADQSDLPTLGQILLDHTAMEDVTVESLEEAIAESYATKMY